jgi:hypothetical protein
MDPDEGTRATPRRRQSKPGTQSRAGIPPALRRIFRPEGPAIQQRRSPGKPASPIPAACRAAIQSSSRGHHQARIYGRRQARRLRYTQDTAKMAVLYNTCSICPPIRRFSNSRRDACATKPTHHPPNPLPLAGERKGAMEHGHRAHVRISRVRIAALPAARFLGSAIQGFALRDWITGPSGLKNLRKAGGTPVLRGMFEVQHGSACATAKMAVLHSLC